jgi:hypothetical protein
MIELDAGELFKKEYDEDNEFSIWDILNDSDPKFSWVAVDSRELSDESLEYIDWMLSKQHGIQFVSIDDGSDHWFLSTIKTEELNMIKAHESGLTITKSY